MREFNEANFITSLISTIISNGLFLERKDIS